MRSRGPDPGTAIGATAKGLLVAGEEKWELIHLRTLRTCSAWNETEAKLREPEPRYINGQSERPQAACGLAQRVQERPVEAVL